MQSKQIVSLVLDLLILICAGFGIYFVYIYTDVGINRPIAIALFVFIVVLLLLFEVIAWSRPARLRKTREPEISKLTLLGENDRSIREWDLSGKVGWIIGKSIDGQTGHPVSDIGFIDLFDIDYDKYIDPEHALINYIQSGWWVQNVSVSNDISILRKGKELLLGHGASDRLHKGDILCIANYTRIAIS